MRLVQATADGRWGLLDQRPEAAAVIAGALPAWAPRIAAGEGRWALPLIGRWEPAETIRDFDVALMFRRVLFLDSLQPGRACGLAAVVGTSLAGRTNPFRSVVGYLAVSPGPDGKSQRFGQVLITRDEFGDRPPSLVNALNLVELDPMSELWAMDRRHGLRSGDVVVLGAAALDAAITRRFSQAPAWEAREPLARKPCA